MKPGKHPTKLKIVNATDIADGFVKALALIRYLSPPGKSTYCWFRGINDNKLSLAPGAIWREDYDEYEAMLTFVQDGATFGKVTSVSDWDTYYLAQHHGMPTRLLDWTESFSAAMFFALDGVKKGKVPCVWIMRPDDLNQKYLNWPGIIAPESEPRLNIWLPDKVRKHAVVDIEGFSYNNDHPLAMYAKKSNSRIVAQQGAFTLHGRDKRPLCQMIQDDIDRPEQVLARIDFKGINIKQARAHLATLGVRRSAIYPDIDNLVKQIGEYYWPTREEKKRAKSSTLKTTKALKKVAKKAPAKKAAAKRAAKKAARR
jgi:hypothetical protein